jgi:hypothetical protein
MAAVGATETKMIRTIAIGTLLAASLAGSSALAQGSYQHHAFCLLTGPAKECAYDSMAQCEAAKHGNVDQCMRNSAPINHPQ